MRFTSVETMNESLTNHLTLGMIGAFELMILLGAFLVFLLVFGALVTFVVWLARRKPTLTPPPVPPAPAVPVRHNCPQCGTVLSPGAAQGLCPRCLMSVGLGTQTVGMTTEPGANNEQPPEVAELTKIFPHLEITELLGRGGMGAVYKARQPQLDRVVALKILSPRLSRDPAFAERFAREARALAKLSHPNIVGIHDFGQAGGFYYFVMEYVDGMNLGQLERTKRFTPQEALAIVPRICEALQYAHDEGVVHRDIKPANILIDTKGRVKIADFGIAKLIGQPGDEYALTHGRTVLGTPHYMAPEQVEKPQDVDHRADIYSLGVVFYEMLTGELPLGRFANPSKKVEMDVRLDEVVLRALEKEPALRYQQAGEVKTMVETIATGGMLPLASSPPVAAASPKRGFKWIWRLGIAVAIIGSLVIGLIVVVGIWRFVGHRIVMVPPVHSGTADSEPASYLARLPQGLVELIAIGKYDGGEGVWWKPGGAIMTDFGFKPVTEKPLPRTLSDNHWYVFQLEGVPNSTVEPEYIIDHVGSSVSEAPKLHRIEIPRYGLAWLIGVPMSLGIDTTDIKIGYPLGEWQPLSTVDAAGVVTLFDQRVTFSGLQEQTWGTELEIRQAGDLDGQRVEIIAFDKAGNLRRPESQDTRREGGLVTYYPKFAGLKRADIQQIQVRVRPIAWVTFANVSLKVQHPSVVRVTDAPLQLSANFLAASVNTATNAPISPYDLQKWHQRIVELNEKDWRDAFAVGQQLAKLPPEHGLQVLQAAWKNSTNPSARQQILKAFQFAYHPKLIEVLELGLLDTDAEVQSWALNYLKGLALRDFSSGYTVGKEWVAKQRGRELSLVVRESAEWLAGEMSRADDRQLRQHLELLKSEADVVRQATRKVPPVMLWSALADKLDSADPKIVEAALRCAGQLEVDRLWAIRFAVPRLAPEYKSDIRAAAASVLGRKGWDWAVDRLLEVLDGEAGSQRKDRGVIWATGQALAEIGSPRAIPRMIVAIERDETYDTIYGIGYFGLHRLTGVTYDESHDGKWWRDWWEKNMSRYSATMTSEPLPPAAPVTKPQVSSSVGFSKEHFAGGNTNQLYYLTPGSTDESAANQARRLLLVLPGGDGGKDFKGFVDNIAAKAVPERYLVAQLVAPKWDEEQFKNLVWPTKANPYAAMQFSTEDFVASVIADIEKQHRLDTNHIYTLTWSSSGPAAYAIGLQERTRVTGSFIAMSVFRPAQLPPLTVAKGRKFYLLHSPEDFIPLRMAEDAKKQLANNGAIVQLQTYEGGHGWHGDPFGMIRTGINWLEANLTK